MRRSPRKTHLDFLENMVYCRGQHKQEAKITLPLLILLGLHLSEYFLVGRKVAEEAGLEKSEGFFQCLAFGFTWWLPIKKS